jgi:hypothetical protein
MAGQINVTAFDRTGGTDTTALADDGRIHLTFQFIPGSNDADIERIEFADNLGKVGTVYAYFDKQCTPENPLYVRWINDLGGYEYQMFDQRKVYEYFAEDYVDFYPYIEDTTMGLRSREIINIGSIRNTVRVGLEQLERKDFDRIRKLIYSPKIDWYDIGLEKWFGITIGSDPTEIWDSGTSKGTVEFIFRLNDTLVQF